MMCLYLFFCFYLEILLSLGKVGVIREEKCIGRVEKGSFFLFRLKRCGFVVLRVFGGLVGF